MNYTDLSQFGSQIELETTTDENMLVSWTDDFEWAKYNPRKDVNRWGLSVTSSDGTLNGIDLDSLYEYNKEHGTDYGEKDFNKATGQWMKKGELKLSSPTGVVFVEGSSPIHKLIILCGGIAYAIMVKLSRLYGSIKYGKLLI